MMSGTGIAPRSNPTISKSLDKVLDKQTPSSAKRVDPGISIRNGPADEMDVDSPTINGTGASKRKSRTSVNHKSMKEPSSDEDDEPIVSRTTSLASRILRLTPSSRLRSDGPLQRPSLLLSQTRTAFPYYPKPTGSHLLPKELRRVRSRWTRTTRMSLSVPN